jgi:hypothetical protein
MVKPTHEKREQAFISTAFLIAELAHKAASHELWDYGYMTLNLYKPTNDFHFFITLKFNSDLDYDKSNGLIIQDIDYNGDNMVWELDLLVTTISSYVRNEIYLKNKKKDLQSKLESLELNDYEKQLLKEIL